MEKVINASTHCNTQVSPMYNDVSTYLQKREI